MAEQGITDGWRDAGFTGPGCVRFAGNPEPEFDDWRDAIEWDMAEQEPGGWYSASYDGPDCRRFITGPAVPA